jgi:hypothetical protein
MAHFAELDENNIVLRVMVINNSDIIDENGKENESIGKEFCHNLYGGKWIQTSYNGNFRNNYAGIDYTYDEVRDAFIPPQTYPSWILDENTRRWKAPVDYPQDELIYEWNEKEGNWKALTFEVTD